MRRTRFGRITATAASAIAVAALVGATSCGGGKGKGDSAGADCSDARQFLAEQAWGPIFGGVCLECHGPGGLASEDNAKFRLLPPEYPGFLDANLEHLRGFVKYEYDGTPMILMKPLGQLEHGGGTKLQDGSPEMELLQELVTQLQASGDGACAPSATAASFEDVVLLDPVATYRKASLHLVGRLPNRGEIDRLLSEGEAALPGLLDALMTEPGFYDRLKDIFNDLLLTNRYYRSNSVGLLGTEEFPESDLAWFENLDNDTQNRVGRAVGAEPLDLIAHIVRNDRPFSEILTANYTVMNPDSARIYNADINFADPNDLNEYHEGKIRTFANGQLVEYPHAGVLTSPMFLNRFPTTPTNRSRHRARMVLQHFLGTDILAVAERPLDPTRATAFSNPTREDSACAVCHSIIDPIAGAFQKFDENDMEEFDPAQEWHPEMFAPGFKDDVMQTTDFPQAPSWLGQRLAADDRFPLATVYTVFGALTGQKPALFPKDAASATFADDLAAWQAQDATLRAIAIEFEAQNLNLKTAIRQVILSPYYRAKNATGPLEPGRAAQLGNVGTGMLSTPELLDRKILAIVGLKWARSYDYNASMLRNDYQILYGGIDSDAVTERLTDPNGVMSNVVWRMANEVSCVSTAYDFTKPAEERTLFPDVQPTDTPTNAEDRIRSNIKYLHALVLGETLEDGHPELERTYRLFFDTWQEGSALVAADQEPSRIVYSCRGRENPITDQELPDEVKVEDDDDYAVRSWMAVMTYLLSDYKFIYE